MTCNAYWTRLIQTTLLNRYPGVFVVRARAYGAPKTLDRPDKPSETFRMPAVERDDADPIRAMKRFLKANYDPDLPSDIVLMYHPMGGFSHQFLSDLP